MKINASTMQNSYQPSRPVPPRRSGSQSSSPVRNDSYTPSAAGSRMIGPVDKGTAAETTILLDSASFDRLMHKTTPENGEALWSEMGGDQDKKWVVINGQRFEYRYTEQEKAAHAAMRGKSLMEYLEEAEQEREKNRTDEPETTLTFPVDPKALAESDDPKLRNLAENAPVMAILTGLNPSGTSRIR